MGTIKQGILGGFSGKVAGVVGSSWKGIAVIKSLPLSVANPRTAAQTAQRNKFAGVVAIASTMLATVVKPMWDRFAQGESGYNAFVKRNIGAFNLSGELDPTLLVISSGKMAATPIASVEAENGNQTLNIVWADDSGQGLKLQTDNAYALVVDADGIVLGSGSDGNERQDEDYSVPLNRIIVTGESLTCYLAFKRADGTVVSDSSYLAKVVTA